MWQEEVRSWMDSGQTADPYYYDLVIEFFEKALARITSDEPTRIEFKMTSMSLFIGEVQLAAVLGYAFWMLTDTADDQDDIDYIPLVNRNQRDGLLYQAVAHNYRLFVVLRKHSDLWDSFERAVKRALADPKSAVVPQRLFWEGKRQRELILVPNTIEPMTDGLALMEDDKEPQEVYEHLTTFLEGAVIEVKQNFYERNNRARAACLAHYGRRCAVCDCDPQEIYGERGSGCLHVHHLIPISEIGHEYHVNPVLDLRPVCPTCHTVLHHGNGSPISIEEARALVNRSLHHEATTLEARED